MIQRIQTLFLLLASASFGAFFMLPFATSDKATAQFLADTQFDVTDHIALMGLTILGILVALLAVFQYNKRALQLKLGYGVIVLAILLPLAAFLLFTNESATMDASAQVEDEAGIFLPVSVILFTALALYYIRKDEKLVKSMDRLR